MDKVNSYLQERFPHLTFSEAWEISPATRFKLGQCYAITEALKFLPLSPRVRQQMLQVALIKGAQATTAIEGNTLSEEEIKKINSGATLPPSRKYLATEVKNVLDALNIIFDQVVNNGAVAPVSIELICNFHRQIGKDLGEAFQAIPGKFRDNEVQVWNYLAPKHQYVKPLMEKLCVWLQQEFKFDNQTMPDFAECVIEAIVAHLYLVWIHPFGDGNGRTARLLEFYLLIRGGLPNICSHILSNHYNNTRSEYYRHIDIAFRERKLTKFIEYAVQGLLDGLNDILWQSQQEQINNAWRTHVYGILDKEVNNKNRRKRLAKILTEMRVLQKYSAAQIIELSVEIGVMYSKLSQRTLAKDLNFLQGLNLLSHTEHGKFSANISPLLSSLPKSRDI